MFDFLAKNWEAIVAVTALLVSFVNTGVLYYTFQLHKTHNLKSVKPIVHIGQWDYENRIYVTLVNLSAGLAMIDKIEVSNKKEESKTCIYDWLPDKLPGEMNYKEYWTVYKNFVVQAGQEIRLIEVAVNMSNSEEIEMREKIRSILRQLTIKVYHKDLYDNPMPTTEIDLHLFSRTDNVN